jgi:transposase
MNKEKVVFIGLDASKATLAVSVAEDGRDGEVRDRGMISTAPTSVEKFLKKLAARFDRVEICYEAGPTGYGLYRQITAFGFTCYVVAPLLIPVCPGERIKTDRRDAERLARLLRGKRSQEGTVGSA